MPLYLQMPPSAVGELPPFSGDDATCPKCGQVGASTTYAIDQWMEVRLNERLRRECPRCRYRWNEAIVEPDQEGE